MPITRISAGAGPDSFNIRKLDDGTWILGIHSEDEFEEFAYDTSKELIASLQNELGSSKEDKEDKKTGFKKMMEDGEGGDNE